jgi:hypothetical protein
MPGMGDEYTVGDEDGLTPTQAAVRDAVCRELYAQLPLRDQRIEWDDIAGVAYAITVSLDRQHLLVCPGEPLHRTVDHAAECRRSGERVVTGL